MIGRRAVALTALVSLVQAGSMDGTWGLARIFRTGPHAGARAVPVDSATYLRLTLASHPGGWLSGRVYRRYLGKPEQSKLVGGALGNTGRYALSADFDYPLKEEAKTAAWRVGRVLRLGTAFVPDADSVELRRIAPNAPDPRTVTVVVTGP